MIHEREKDSPCSGRSTRAPFFDRSKRFDLGRKQEASVGPRSTARRRGDRLLGTAAVGPCKTRGLGNTSKNETPSSNKGGREDVQKLIQKCLIKREESIWLVQKREEKGAQPIESTAVPQNRHLAVTQGFFCSVMA